MLTVGDLMRRASVSYADRIAVISGTRQVSFAEAWERGLRVANALIGLGLSSGDRVAVLEDNTLEAQDTFAGAAAANLVRVPLYARAARPTHAHMIGHTQCRVLIVTAKYLADVRGLDAELPDLERIIVRDEGYEEWLAAQSCVDPLIGGHPDDQHVIRHTGGTTGLPKGVAYTHRKWLASGRDWTYPFPPIKAGDSCMHVSPISHGSGYLYLPMWLHGARNILMASADPQAVLDTVESHQINYFFAVPTVLAALARHTSARDRNYASLKAVLVAGAPISEATALLAHEVFGPVLHQMYGQTEVQPATTLSPQEWFGQVGGSEPLRSAGRASPFSGLEIRGTDGEVLPVGEEGEIAVSSDGQMDGYWQDPDSSSKRIQDGWILTGDIGRLDDNGYLYILDRRDDVIISGGLNIWPAELENVIASHPDVVEVAVFGIPDEKWGETPMAVCVMKEGSKIAEPEIIQMCVSELGSFRKPARVVVQTQPLPKSPVGKLQRTLLRQSYWAGQARRVSGS
jgi:acyl-CoA synthetase (AMP-forming)/AMP-acid ligase II